MQISGFILAGGQSSRMGSDKSQLTIEGQTFVRRIAGELARVASDVAIVGATSHEDLPRIGDVYPGWGALGGVHAALAACSTEWALIVACDFPFVTADLFNHLAGLSEGFEAVAPIQEDGIPQPLCAMYRVDPCLQHAEALIKSGERKPIALLQSVRTRWVLFDEIASLRAATNFFDNINTPQDYERLLKKGA